LAVPGSPIMIAGVPAWIHKASADTDLSVIAVYLLLLGLRTLILSPSFT
jgi:hypothetical protein